MWLIVCRLSHSISWITVYGVFFIWFLNFSDEILTEYSLLKCFQFRLKIQLPACHSKCVIQCRDIKKIHYNCITVKDIKISDVYFPLLDLFFAIQYRLAQRKWLLLAFLKPCSLGFKSKFHVPLSCNIAGVFRTHQIKKVQQKHLIGFMFCPLYRTSLGLIISQIPLDFKNPSFLWQMKDKKDSIHALGQVGIRTTDLLILKP